MAFSHALRSNGSLNLGAAGDHRPEGVVLHQLVGRVLAVPDHVERAHRIERALVHREAQCRLGALHVGNQAVIHHLEVDVALRGVPCRQPLADVAFEHVLVVCALLPPPESFGLAGHVLHDVAVVVLPLLALDLHHRDRDALALHDRVGTSTRPSYAVTAATVTVAE